MPGRCRCASMRWFRTIPAFNHLRRPAPSTIRCSSSISSGTTGKPKCIVHGIGGTLLQHLKEHRLHVDLRPDDVLFFFTTCGWMMWNWLVSGLASGAPSCSTTARRFSRRRARCSRSRSGSAISVFGVSAKYLSSVEKAGIRPAPGP